MGHFFVTNANRKIFIAEQNCFDAPIEHPSRTLNEHIISYVIEGGWHLDIGAEKISVKENNVFIQPSKIRHTGTKKCPPHTRTMFVHFEALDGDEFFIGEKPCETDGKMYINTTTDASHNPQILKNLKKIIEEKAKGNDTKASVYLNLLLCELSESSMFSQSKSLIGNKIKKIIIDSPDKNLTNADIAKMLSISKRSAETVFKNSFGTTIHKYLITQKCEMARFYLEYYPEMKILDIASSLGFYDEYHFSKVFKREVGISPKKYRENLFKNSIS